MLVFPNLKETGIIITVSNAITTFLTPYRFMKYADVRIYDFYITFRSICHNLFYTWQVTLFHLFKTTFNIKETRVNHYKQNYVHFSLCDIGNSVTAGKAITSWSLKRRRGISVGQ